ncbi:MAG: 1-acyl-sn-glycerol-3-phosphate acyltransferase [Actinomycetota bacterium]|nr:1-acyl-sn-glycerol-3-phosphate acyltransferase [Actinomycetota bacterium]
MNTSAILWWGVGRTVLEAITRAFVPVRAYGKDRVPRVGGVVLALNHLAWIDVPVYAILCPRRIQYLAKAEAHEVPGLGHFIRAFGTLSVRRGESDREAVRLAREVVRANGALGMFVEGTRQQSGQPGKARPGAAMIAVQEGVPVVPGAIHNSHRWRVGNFEPVSVSWGEPMRLDHLPRNARGYREATAEIEGEVRRLWEFLAEMHRLGRPAGTPPRRTALPRSGSSG